MIVVSAEAEANAEWVTNVVEVVFDGHDVSAANRFLSFGRGRSWVLAGPNECSPSGKRYTY
jgi:hypothetical protein